MKTHVNAIVISLALVMCAWGAQANESTPQAIKRQAPVGISTVFYTCVENAASENIALAACQSAEKKRQDVRLNAAYKALISKQRGATKDSLIRAERAWLDFHSAARALSPHSMAAKQ